MKIHAANLRPGWVLVGDEGNLSTIYSVDIETREARLLDAVLLSTEHGVMVVYNENPEVEVTNGNQH